MIFDAYFAEFFNAVFRQNERRRRCTAKPQVTRDRRNLISFSVSANDLRSDDSNTANPGLFMICFLDDLLTPLMRQLLAIKL